MKSSSQQSSLLELAVCVLTDATAGVPDLVPDLRDFATLRSRVEHGGISFLTISLPNFCADFDRSLARGYIAASDFQYFRKNGAIPAFLQGMLGLLFDRRTGKYDPQVSLNIAIDLVDRIRQVCLAFKKVKLPCSPARENKAIRSYEEVEQDFDKFSLPDDSTEEYQFYLETCNLLWGRMFRDFCCDSLVPRHGPGATADGFSGNGKYRWRKWYDRLEPYFPLVDSAYVISAADSEEVQKVDIVPKELELPAKVVLVPKTLKGPRIIAKEPCCMQYAQQAIRDYLYQRLESRFIGDERLDISVAGHINFRDQTVNQELAVMSSIDGFYATIDLSEASDRVPRELAYDMFLGCPDLLDAIDACRSEYAELPNGTVVGPLRKFASMGSALCFPVEAMYFYTICVMALTKSRNLPLTIRSLKSVGKDVYVYGDDILVPAHESEMVMVYLHKYNCKVNVSKTYTEGNFRESCGHDAYNGKVVTPLYIRNPRPNNRRQANEIVSWVSTANSFYKKGYWNTAEHMFGACERILGPLPYVEDESSALGRQSFQQKRSFQRWNDRYHAHEILAWVAEPVYRTDILDGYEALQKSLSTLTRLKHEWEVRDEEHLKRSARHGVVTLKRRWVLVS